MSEAHEPEHGAPLLLVRAARDFKFSDADIATMFGFPTVEESNAYLHQFKRGDKIPNDENGIKMRTILRIFCAADGLFDDNDVVIDWLNQKATELGNKSPREKLLEGNIDIVNQYIWVEGNPGFL
jgi:hypothetical protein